jgi:hypothetical protein
LDAGAAKRVAQVTDSDMLKLPFGDADTHARGCCVDCAGTMQKAASLAVRGNGESASALGFLVGGKYPARIGPSTSELPNPFD